MSAGTNVIKASLDIAAYCVNAYLQNLSDEDLLVRPSKVRITWLGHLITDENNFTNMVCPESMSISF